MARVTKSRAKKPLAVGKLLYSESNRAGQRIVELSVCGGELESGTPIFFNLVIDQAEAERLQGLLTLLKTGKATT